MLDMAQFGSEVLVLQAVQRGGRVHTACLHTSIAVTGRHTGSYGGGDAMPDDAHACSLVFSFSCCCVF